VETPGSHSVYVSHPDKVAQLVDQAASAIVGATNSVRHPIPAE